MILKIREIISIASGIVGDNKINCHKAREVGIAAMSKMTGETFNIKLKRADKVLPLLTMSSTIKVHDEKVPLGPVLLFQHISISKTFEDEIEKFFEYELAPYPLSMFDETGMRKTQKSAIYNCFESMEIEIDNSNTSYIIDGGYLLHRVVWDREATFNVTFDKYIQYVHRHFSHRVSIVVFDGYTDYKKNIKAAEQRCRTTKVSSSPDVIFDQFMTVPTNQQQFLSNTHNKSRFIFMLCERFTAANIIVK